MGYEKIQQNIYKISNNYCIIKKVHGEVKKLRFDSEVEAKRAYLDLDKNKWNIDTMLKYKDKFISTKTPPKPKKKEPTPTRYIHKCKKGYYILKTIGNIRYTKGYYQSLEEAEKQRDKYEEDWKTIENDYTKALTINKSTKPQKKTKTPPKPKKPSNIKETIIFPSEYMTEFKENAKKYEMNVHDYVLLMVEVGRQQFNRLNFIPEYEKE